MKIKFIFLLLFSFFLKGSFAQITAGMLSAADKKYDEFAYPEAIERYKYLLKKGDSSANVIRSLANSYRLTNNSKEAEYWYEYIVSKHKCNSNDVFNYVLLLRGNEKYNKADSVLKKFEYKFRRDSRIERHHKQPNYIDTLKAKENDYYVKLLNINSVFQDLSPAFYKDQLVFVSSRSQKNWIKREYNWTNEAFLDYYSFKIPKSAKEADEIKVTPFSKKLNSVLHEGQIVFSGNGKEAYFTTNNIKRGYKYRSSTGIAQLMIYRADWIDGDWGNIRPMRFNVQEFSYAYPTLSNNGKTLYFCSNRSGGYGGADIYKVERDKLDSDWSGPINLGAEINTEGDELFPFIHLSGELYFSSNGHPGLGGIDVFKASNIDNQIKVENLGYGINSPKDDFGFILNERGDGGFFSSDREGGYGMDDIYGFTYSKAHFEKMQLVKLAGIADSLYILDVNDPGFIEDPALLEELKNLGFVKGSVVSIRASDISKIEDEELREKLRKLGLFDHETLAMMLDEDSLFEEETKRKRLKKLSMIQDSIYTMDLSDSDLLNDLELVAKLTELGYLKGNVLTIKASEISKLEDEGLKDKLTKVGLYSREGLVEKNEERLIAAQTKAEETSKEDSSVVIAPRKKLEKLDMIKDSLYTIELSEDDFLDDPGLYAELEEMGYIKDNVLKIKASELKKLDRNIKERLAKIGMFDRQTLGLAEPMPAVISEKNEERLLAAETKVEETSKEDSSVVIAPRKKLKKLDMIKDSLYTIELSEDDFLDDPGLYAELEEMGYIKDNVLKIKASELKKLDRNIKERLAKIGMFDRQTLGLEALIPAVVSKKKEFGDYFIFTGSIQEHNSTTKLKGVKIIIKDQADEGKEFVGKTDETGLFRDTVNGYKPNSDVSLFIIIKKKGYISKSFQFEEHLGEYGAVNLNNFLKKIQMTKFDINVELGAAANLNPIYFEYNKSTISEEAKKELDKLTDILLEEPRLLIELGSHTDSKGNDEYNLALSERRAQATKEYVVSKGVEAYRIKAVGYGETKLINNCSNNVQCADKDHAVNRRTEFRVIGLN